MEQKGVGSIAALVSVFFLTQARIVDCSEPELFFRKVNMIAEQLDPMRQVDW